MRSFRGVISLLTDEEEDNEAVMKEPSDAFASSLQPHLVCVQ